MWCYGDVGDDDNSVNKELLACLFGGIDSNVSV